jgi:hypothetical protein
MIKYIFAIIVIALLFRTEITGNLKLIWGVFASLVTYAILFFIDLIKELNL